MSPRQLGVGSEIYPRPYPHDFVGPLPPGGYYRSPPKPKSGHLRFGEPGYAPVITPIDPYLPPVSPNGPYFPGGFPRPPIDICPIDPQAAKNKGKKPKGGEKKPQKNSEKPPRNVTKRHNSKKAAEEAAKHSHGGKPRPQPSKNAPKHKRDQYEEQQGYRHSESHPNSKHPEPHYHDSNKTKKKNPGGDRRGINVHHGYPK